MDSKIKYGHTLAGVDEWKNVLMLIVQIYEEYILSYTWL
jgi:hypothetical protein